MSLTFTYPHGTGEVVRAYVKGFVGLASYDMFIANTNELHLDRPSTFDTFVFWITDRFLAPTSNVYSLDYVFDPALSYFRHNGVDIPNSLTVTLVYDPTEFQWRIAIQEGVNTDFTVKADLAPLPHYWRPI